MNYILDSLRFFPIALFVTSIVYLMLYMILKNKRNKPALSKIIFEYVLVGYFIMFIYVTHFMFPSNGYAFERHFNIIPMDAFLSIFRYGFYNDEMVIQFYLNILMCVPLGILLPVVFPKRFRSFLPVLAVSFLTTLITELNQLLINRSADIDDVIANTLGGLLGYAVFVLIYVFYYRMSAKKYKNPNEIKRMPLKITISIFLILLTFAPFGIIKSIKTFDEIGQKVEIKILEPNYLSTIT